MGKMCARLSKWKWLLPHCYRGRVLIINNSVNSTLWHRLTVLPPQQTIWYHWSKVTGALLASTGGRTGTGGHCLSAHGLWTADSSETAVQLWLGLDRHGLPAAKKGQLTEREAGHQLVNILSGTAKLAIWRARKTRVSSEWQKPISATPGKNKVAGIVYGNIFTKFALETRRSKWTLIWRWTTVIISCGTSRYRLVNLVDQVQNRTVMVGVAIPEDKMRWETGEISGSEQLDRG